MKKSDLDQVCDPTTTVEAKEKLASMLKILSGLSAQDARDLLRLAGNAVDRMPVMPTLDF